MKRWMFVAFAAVLLGALDAPAQGPRAPAQPRPLWFSSASLATGLAVYEPNYNQQIASMGPLAGYFPGPYAVDPFYPTYSGNRTCMQVNAVPGAPVFVRWGLPPRSMWGPTALLQQIGTPSAALGTKVHSMIIATNGDMVTVEDLPPPVGATHLVLYPAGGGPPQIPGSLFAVYTIARVTLDYNNQYWVAAWDTNQPTNVDLWSWTPSGGFQQRPTLTWLSPIPPYEELSWITTERPVSGYTQGIIHVTTRFSSTTEGYLLYIFDPVVNAWILFLMGGNQAWPDPSLGQPGNGVVGTFVALNLLIAPPPFIVYYSRGPNCTTLTPILPQPGPALTGAMQMDFTPAVSGLVVTMWGSAWSFDYYSMPSCAAAGTLLMSAQATGVWQGLGYGWQYSQYITTGTITSY